MFNLTPTVRLLLFLNLGVFAAQMYFLPGLTEFGSLYPFGSPYLRPWQFLTYMFLHAGWGHIFSNMFGLISFGPMLEQRWGGPRFLTFWLICGVGAGVLYQGVRYYELARMEQARQDFRQNPSSGEFADFFRRYLPEATGYENVAAQMQREPNNPELLRAANETLDAIVGESRDSRNAGMLGASGALFGLLFAFAYLFPNTELFLLFFPFPVKAKYFVFFYAAYELWKGVHRTPGDNVAHFAHLGGLVIGFVLVKIWEQGRQRFY